MEMTMSGTIRKIAMITGILLVTASLVWAGPTHVSNLRLSHEGSFTVLTVEGNGIIRTAHQSVEAKEGKPFRIVIDCLASRHMLKQKSFSSMPASVITSIRTSQYAVTPEEVVRIVLDLKEESVYRVESVDNQVKILVSDTRTPAFAEWTAQAEKAPAVKARPTVTQTKVPVAMPTPKAVPSVKTKKPSVLAQAKTKTEPAKKTTKPVVKKAEVKESPVLSQALAPPKPTSVAKPAVKQDRDTPIDKKPVPLQVKLGLAGTKEKNTKKPVVVAQKQETKKTTLPKVEKTEKPVAKKPAVVAHKQTAVRKIEPVKSEMPAKIVLAKNTDTEQPVEKAKIETAAKKPVTQKKPSIVAHRQSKDKSAAKINTNVTNDTIKRAMVFAAVDNDAHNLPRPGDEPKKSGSTQDDKHKQVPAKKSSPPVKNTEAAKSKPAPVKEDKGKVLASATTTKTVAPTVPKKINSLPAPKKESQKVLASTTTKQVPQPGPAAANKPSRFRRSTAKSARLKQAQVVQFPQRIVIKYKAATGRDPFKTLIDIEKQASGRVDLNKIPNIETLSLVGIIETPKGGGKDAALLEDRDGIGYILKTGDRVRNGYVAQIDEHAIYFQINEYGWSRTVVKQMEKEK